MDCTTLSVIMPNYNYAHFIGDALEAIISQSLRPHEVIIVDDGSTDDSVAVIEQFVKRDSIVRLLCNGRNMGAFFSANRGIEHATGDYVYFAAADDRVLPGLFKKSLDLLAQFPEAGLCCSDFCYLDESKGVIREKKFRLSSKPHYFSRSDMGKLIQKRYFPIGGLTIVMKRSALVEVGGFDYELGWQCDWFVDFVVAFRYGMCYIPETLAVARLHQKCGSLLYKRRSITQLNNLNHMLNLLHSKRYSDVLPYFQKSDILCRFRSRVVIRSLFNNPQYINFLTPVSLRRALRLRILSILNLITPDLVKRIYNRWYYRQYTRN